jgi:hypothetical protein
VMVADLVVAVGRGDEVARNHLGALVDQLVEGVLAVRARFTPEDRAGLVVLGSPFCSYAMQTLQGVTS